MIYFIRHGQTDLNLYAKGKLDSLGHFEWLAFDGKLILWF